MAIDVSAGSDVGEVRAFGTHGRGLNVEEIAELALRKLIHIGDTAPPVLREQAHQFRERIRYVLIHYLHQAIKSDRTTLYNELRGAGFPEVADIVLKI
jgi:hypothetical protein